MARTPSSLLTTTVSTKGKLDTLSAALRTRELLLYAIFATLETMPSNRVRLRWYSAGVAGPGCIAGLGGGGGGGQVSTRRSQVEKREGGERGVRRSQVNTRGLESRYTTAKASGG